MGRMYSAVFSAVSLAAAQDLFEIVAPADSVVVIHSIHLSQTSDTGDASEELLLVKLNSGATTSGSGGSSYTPVPLNFGDAAFGGTCEINNTTQAADGTIVTHLATAWNVRAPLDIVFTPETRPILSPSRRAVITLSAPADALTGHGTVFFEEIGG